MNAPVRWQPDRSPRPVSTGTFPMPALGTALGRGLAGRCPSCGRTRLFAGYLRVTAVCPVCDALLGAARADDAPPYFTILVVGHIVVPSMLLLQRMEDLSDLAMAAIFLPLTAALSLLLLRPIKGATVGLMLKLGLMKSEE